MVPTHLMRAGALEEWGYVPAWKPVAADCDIDVEAIDGAPIERWLVFLDEAGLGRAVVERLRAAGQDVVTVRAGDGYGRDGEGGFVLSPERGRDGYDALLEDLASRDWKPEHIAHFWLVTKDRSHRPGSSFFHRNQEQGFYALLFLAQAMAAADWGAVQITAFTTGAAQMKREPLADPEKLTLRGPVKVIPREMPGVTCRTLDLEWLAKRAGLDGLTEPVLEELFAAPGNSIAALRGARRYEQRVRERPLTAQVPDAMLRAEGVYLITGGFGGIGLTLAERMIREHDARVVLMARRALPPRDEWAGYVRRFGGHDPVARRIAAVERLEAMGGHVMVVSGDVSNVEDMRGALEKVQMRFGPVNGVIHAAGVIHDEPLLSKTPMVVEDVFTPKIHGVQVLDQVFEDGALDFMVLFSSTSTVTAPAGQVDYVAANEYLNGFARARRGGKTRVIALNWGIWAEVGMAAEALGAGGAEVAARAGVQQRAVRRLDRAVAGFQPQAAHRVDVRAVAFLRRPGQPGQLLAQPRGGFFDLGRLDVEEAVDVTERRFEAAHFARRVAHHADAEADLQQDEAGADQRQEFLSRVRQHLAVRHEDVAQADVPGARALQGAEMRVLAGAHVLHVAGDQRHDQPAFDRKDDAEVVVGAEVGDVGHIAAHDIAAVDPLALQAQRLDLGDRLHRVGQAGAAEHPARPDLDPQRLAKLLVGGVLQVPGKGVLAPDAKRRGEAGLGDDGHGLARRPDVDPARKREAREMLAIGAGVTQGTQDVLGIQALEVDLRGAAGEVALHDFPDVAENIRRLGRRS
jgi:NAD(P)-dependent dehydrogenase (short-subunit alcohol dehydrogenase family)